MNDDQKNPASLPLGQHLEPEDWMSYLLDLLPPEERQAAEAHLGTGCALCRQELTTLEDDLGIFAVASITASGLENPPARSRERLMAEIADAGNSAMQADSLDHHESPAAQAPAMSVLQGGQAAVAGQPRSAGSQVAPRFTAWIGWTVAAALALVAVHFYQDRQSLRNSLATQDAQIAQLTADQARARQVVDALTDRGAQRVTLTLTKAPGPPQPTGRATYLANKGTLIFLASHLDPLPAGKTYELWVIPASGAAPVPVGTFGPDAKGNANVVSAKLEGVGAAKALGVTIENAGGSTTPTMPILLAGS